MIPRIAILSFALHSLFYLAKAFSTTSTKAIEIIHQFPNTTGLENLAVRQNGNLLITDSTAPNLYLLDPTSPTSAPLVYTFPNATTLTGIGEVAPDVFAINVVSFASLTPPVISYSTFWKIDMRSFEASPDGAILKNATAELITAIPNATLPNGLVALAGTQFFLVADSVEGVVWRINYETGEYGVILSDTLLLPVTILGVNGIQIFGPYLYFTNTDQGIFGRVPVLLDGPDAGSATGGFEVVANVTGDDFTFDGEGNAYVAQHYANGVELVTVRGETEVIAGGVNSTVFASDTACKFGRRQGPDGDTGVLYVVTDGGNVVAVDVEKLGVETGF